MKIQQKFLQKILVAPLLFICMCCFSQSSLRSLPVSSTATPGTIEFVKGDAMSLTFVVHLPQIPEKGCLLRISDQTGEVLFEKRIRASKFQETYKIDRSNLSKLNFEATGKNFRFQESFNLRFVMEEKIEVTKL